MRFHLVPRLGIEAEEGAAILEADARVARHDAGTPHARKAVDEAYDIVVLVRDGEVHGVALLHLSGFVFFGGLLGLNEFPPRCRVRFGKQSLQGNPGKAGIGDVTPAIRKRKLLGLHEVVQVVRRVVSPRFEIQSLQDVEHDQGRQSLAIGRQLVDVIPFVIDADGLHPFGFVLGQISGGKDAALRAHGAHDLPGNFPFIEGLLSGGGDLAQRAAQVFVGHDLSVRRRPAVHEIGL